MVEAVFKTSFLSFGRTHCQNYNVCATRDINRALLVADAIMARLRNLVRSEQQSILPLAF
jgi:hypothetical protein